MSKESISIAEKMYRELPITIRGSIGWYDGLLLNYDEEEFCKACKNMMLEPGDKITITISKINGR